MEPKKLSAGILGLGQVGFDFDNDPKRKNDGIWTHFSAYQKLSHLYDLTVAIEPDQKKWAGPLQRQPQLKLFQSLAEFKQAQIPLAVLSICTPDALHLQNIEDCPASIKGIFLEKPISKSEEFEWAKKVIQAWMAQKKSVFVNYFKRLNPLVIKFRQECKELNQKIRYAQVNYSGPFHAMGSHAIDLLNTVCPIGDVFTPQVHPHPEGFGLSCLAQGQTGQMLSINYTGPRENLVFELDIQTDQKRYFFKNNLGTLAVDLLKESPRYTRYFEYVPHENHETTDSLKFINYLELLYHDIEAKEKSYNNVLMALRTQELMNLMIQKTKEIN